MLKINPLVNNLKRRQSSAELSSANSGDLLKSRGREEGSQYHMHRESDAEYPTKTDFRKYSSSIGTEYIYMHYITEERPKRVQIEAIAV